MNKLSEFVRRHKWETIYVAIAGLALLIFLIGTNIGWTTEERIEKAYCRNTGHSITFRWADKKHDKKGNAWFYGTYDGCDVFLFGGMAEGFGSSVKLGGYDFKAGTWLFIHRKGEILRLREAYDRGLISDSSLKLIHEEHQSWYEP